MKEKIEDFTEAEFLEFVRRIFKCEYKTESESNEAVRQFSRLVEHPSKSDLIFYPERSRPNTPEGVVEEVKAWRAANGKPGFKESSK